MYEVPRQVVFTEITNHTYHQPSQQPNSSPTTDDPYFSHISSTITALRSSGVSFRQRHYKSYIYNIYILYNLPAVGQFIYYTKTVMTILFENRTISSIDNGRFQH